ncbi:MAG TPA: oxidoreductase, partial [Rhodospirillaceae bacterium]|nr:oxidoreductase [Rhodospirillaceae bacterium]
SQEAAVEYAKAQGYTYTVTAPKERRIKPKAYADNFAFHRRQPWTH